VHVQQDYAKTSTFLQEVDPAKLIEDALRINMISLERHGVHIERRTADLGVIRLDRHKTLQILTNLISNAKNALKKIDDAEKRTIIVGLGPAEVDGRRFVRFWVEDNGVGISQENMPRMFTHGFTTSAEGHGFGLHASINAAREMGGTLTVVSEGTGHGARFTLELPMVEEPAVEGREVTSS
jgi:two-component system NtrC family sensor kinase